MEILVIGAGSLGSLVGGLLAREHEVTLVGTAAHVETVRASGLLIEGKVQDRVHPAATTDPAGASPDLAIVTAKAYDTDRAVATLADCDVGAVWSLQNGLGNEERLAAGLDAPVLAGTATYGADQSSPGVVTCTGLGEVAIGPRPGTSTPEEDAERARELGEGLSAACAREGGDGGDSGHRLRVVVDDAMPERLWLKLAVNAGVNPVAALSRVKNGALVKGEAGATARRAAREVARVARAQGVGVADDAAVTELEAVIAATADNRSSMLQDVSAGDRTEIDAIAGAAIDRADEHEVAVPTIRTLASLVRTWERGRELR